MDDNLNIVYNESKGTVRVMDSFYLEDHFDEDGGDEVLICVSGAELADEIIEGVVKRFNPNVKELESLYL